jgi:hypothetical protein
MASWKDRSPSICCSPPAGNRVRQSLACGAPAVCVSARRAFSLAENTRRELTQSPSLSMTGNFIAALTLGKAVLRCGVNQPRDSEQTYLPQTRSANHHNSCTSQCRYHLYPASDRLRAAIACRSQSCYLDPAAATALGLTQGDLAPAHPFFSFSLPLWRPIRPSC